MSAPTIHVTRGHAQEAYYPMCAASGAIARAFNTRTFSRRALAAFQDLGITVIADGEPQSNLANDTDGGAEPNVIAFARPLHNQTGE